ncbi:MAG: glutamyl-tRNA(Gln) amidotransferase subunit E [Thermoplasmata archaeon M11B2D]|nr:MAG: glutamyl-tRNA(Gln) amidotransferase subunit E [Thermoplasmata archaeon M11B2D]
MDMDYNAIGFKAGLEIHQQLETHKLFCQCHSKLTDEKAYSFERVLRPTQSELGDVDQAALEEASRKRRFRYITAEASTCLVEADEEPPHTANNEAIDICLTIALLLNAIPVDEIQFMRKIVIDGSNTTGFQRTALVAMGGLLQNVRIVTLSLEEDAARKLSEEEKVVHYGLDRLGIPLIEITTEADITSPEHAQQIAEQLGMLLQATKKVKRGLGTIRQDLNVSIARGARVEIKGIQSLSAISKVAEQEALRQKEISEISETLRTRASKNDLMDIICIDVSAVFINTSSNFIQNMRKKNACVKGIRLPGYQGLLKQRYTRLGKDFSIYARLASGIGGIIHSDEMPGYGLSEQEIAEVHQLLHIGNQDAFVLALGDESMVKKALDAVLRRAMMYFDGVPEEVRRSLADNTTEYMRPLPGAARMYPETDVPPVRITLERLHTIQLPEKPLEKRQRLSLQYNLNKEQLTQLLSSGYEDDFERYATQFPGLENVILRTYLNILPEFEKQGIQTETIPEDLLTIVFSALKQGEYAKEALPAILRYLLMHPTASFNDALKECGLYPLDEEAISQMIHAIVVHRRNFVKEKGIDSIGPLMGLVMKQLRGKADGKQISTILEKEIRNVMSS